MDAATKEQIRIARRIHRKANAQAERLARLAGRQLSEDERAERWDRIMAMVERLNKLVTDKWQEAR